jgi:hypothetical protein
MEALPTFRLLVSRCLVPAPGPAHLAACEGRVPGIGRARPGPEGAPILAAAVRRRCPWRVTSNGRHLRPGHPAVTVLPPGRLILRVRDRLARLDLEEGA